MEVAHRTYEHGAAASEFFERRKALRFEGLQRDADGRQAMGMAYVWGRQDAIGPHARNSEEALAFGYDYGLHALDYYEERTCHLRNVQDAYERWTSTGRIS